MNARVKDGPVISREIPMCRDGGHVYPVPMEMIQNLNSTDWSRLIRCPCGKKEKRLIDLYPEKNGAIDLLPNPRIGRI